MQSPETYESKSEWLRAARSYQRILRSHGQPDPAALWENIGRCLFHAAMQENSRAAFQSRVLQAITAYKRSASVSERDESRKLRSLAWQSFLRYWLTRSSSLKKRALDEAFALTEQALSSFEEKGNVLEYSRTFDELFFSYALGFDYETTAAKRGRKLQFGIERCRRAIVLLGENGPKEVLSRHLTRLALFIDKQGNEVFDQGNREKIDAEGLESWRKATQIHKKAALLAVGWPPQGFSRILDEEECTTVSKDALTEAEKVRDNFSIGWLLDQQAGFEFFKGTWADSEAGLTDVQRSLKISEKAERLHNLVNFVAPTQGTMWAGYPYPEHFLGLSWCVSDTTQRRLYREKGLRETERLERLAKRSGFPEVLMYFHHIASAVSQFLSDVEPRIGRKKRLLWSALQHRIAFSKISNRIHPDDIWSRATALRYTGSIRAKLAEHEKNRTVKVSLLKTAARDKELASKSAVTYAKNVSKGQRNFIHDQVGNIYIELATLLDNLYAINSKETVLRRSAEASIEGAEWYRDSADHRTLGLAFWRAAYAFDRLQAFTLAAENFSKAASAYLIQSDQRPVILANLHREYSRYLEAWNNIELARVAHRRLAYEEAAKFYETAAELHNSTSRWKFAAPYYRALSKLERAEEQSRHGLHEQSVSTLKEARQAFRESTVSLQRHSVPLERTEERSMVESLAMSSNDDYCLARIQLEEARTNEEHGDYHSAAEKYGLVAEKLRELSKTAKQNHERDNMLFLSGLCIGWQAISLSMIRDSATCLKTAAEQFGRSLRYPTDNNAKSLAAGYRHLCLGTVCMIEYAETLKKACYDDASKHLTLAEEHFASAGFPEPSANAQSSKLLLDAHVQIGNASSENDLQKKTEYLRTARALIDQASQTFTKVQQWARAEQMRRLATSLTEQVQLRTRLAEVSKLASDISSAFVFPGSLGHYGEAALGHSRFAGPDLETRYDIRVEKEDDNISIVFEIANTGNQPVKLVALNGVVPDGSRLVSGPEGSKLEGGSLVFKPTPLGKLAAETLSLTIARGKNRKILVLSPQIVFMDETGTLKNNDLPTRMLGSSPILDFLISEFLDDYKGKRLSAEHSGWRTMTTVAETAHVPRSQLYGEPRWGHPYGSQLETLIRAGVVESRIFPGERGRGGKIAKIRAAFDSHLVSELIAGAETSKSCTSTKTNLINS